jgi:hypothetical protein
VKSLYVILLLILGTQAQAQTKPTCWPKQAGSTGSSYKRGETDTLRWIAWTCATKTKTVLYVYSAPKSYEVIHPDTKDMTTIKTVEAYFVANVKAAADPQAVAAAQAAFK